MDNRKIDVVLINFKDEIDDLSNSDGFISPDDFATILPKYRERIVKLFAIPVVVGQSEQLCDCTDPCEETLAMRCTGCGNLTECD